MKPNQQILIDYANVLNEARIRILGINTIVTGTTSLPPWITAELGYLQLRMLCELVALGCLIAHGDLQAFEAKKLHGEYAADRIIKAMERLHPGFYPRPVTSTHTPDGLHLDPIVSGFLSKEELVELYRECGEHLHRGSAKRIFHATQPKRPPELEKVFSWGSKFSALLSQHLISSPTKNEHLLCFISHEQAGGESLVIFAQAPDLTGNDN